MSFKTLAAIYEDVRRRVVEARDAAFPVGSVVCKISQAGFNSSHWGMVVRTCEDIEPYKLAIQFENGNVWNKDADEWEVISNSGIWPDFIWRMVRAKRAQERKAEKAANCTWTDPDTLA